MDTRHQQSGRLLLLCRKVLLGLIAMGAEYPPISSVCLRGFSIASQQPVNLDLFLLKPTLKLVCISRGRSRNWTEITTANLYVVGLETLE